MEPMVNVTNITKRFNLSKKQQKIEKTHEKIKVAVDGLSFQAYSGEIYGLLGPNGAGKTTTLRCISTLIKPDTGEVTVNGHSIHSNPDGVRRTVGFLTSDFRLEDFFTPNYLFDYFSKLHGIDEAKIKIRKEMLFDKFGIDNFKEVKIGELSSGMKQKVQLAISLVHDPSVIVFDEPTNGLDVITAKVVTDYLLELKKEGKTIIVSTHIFSLVEKLCDRVGIIINGKMIFSDLMANVMMNHGNLEPLFFDLYEKANGEL
ncbi:MAG: ABC transporter ATP-binding protein [Firmicutes bacterium]|nr:ABC transporter ATP-binding protein [Bacillota bacterium]